MWIIDVFSTDDRPIHLHDIADCDIYSHGIHPQIVVKGRDRSRVTIVVEDIRTRLSEVRHIEEKLRRCIVAVHLKQTPGIVGYLPLPPKLVQISMVHEEQWIVAAINEIPHYFSNGVMATDV